jgi:hypothetical protein
MVEKYVLEIDTSYWKLDDKDWVADRKAQWNRIEPMFQGSAHKSKKGLGIIKKYFLKGEIPDFKALYEWNGWERHLDLFCFLWLHPENDEVLLAELRDLYVNLPHVLSDDVSIGISIFLSFADVRANDEYTEAELPTILNTNGHNEMYFRLMMGDSNGAYRGTHKGNRWKVDRITLRFISQLSHMTRLLCNKTVNKINEDVLYQYDSYLDFWYGCIDQNEDCFEGKRGERRVPIAEKALYRIHNFDTEKEGDTCRTRFVKKMRKILDEREFIPQFKQMWADVKADKIEVENPWKR